MATVSKKKLNKSINQIRDDINKGFDDVIGRLDALEASDAQNSMAIRNLQIQMQSKSGSTYQEISMSTGLSTSRIGQIVNGR
jgi:uncharacterized protein YerC